MEAGVIHLNMNQFYGMISSWITFKPDIYIFLFGTNIYSLHSTLYLIGTWYGGAVEGFKNEEQSDGCIQYAR